MPTHPTPQITTEFINLQSDYGFKRAFGTKRFQNNVVRLLKAALGEDICICRITRHREESNEPPATEVRYHDKEVLPTEKDGKRIVYDVYFTINMGKDESAFKPFHLQKGESGKNVEHHFILEMQNVYTPPFEDRMVYYMSKIVSEQGRAGWNYDLDPVILIGITDFDFPHLTKQPVHEFEFREKTTGESLTKKLRMLFYSLKQVPEEWEECNTDLEKQLYLIKNMDKMDKESKPYKEGGYEELFDSAESANVVGEDVVLYSKSLAHLREVQSGLDFRYEQGKEEGREVEKESTAKILIMMGQDDDFIERVTGLSLEKIRFIRKSLV